MSCQTVSKSHGPWKNIGSCQATGEYPSCGPGRKNQKRTCTDGTIDKCTKITDTDRTVACSIAGSSLPEGVIGNILDIIIFSSSEFIK